MDTNHICHTLHSEHPVRAFEVNCKGVYNAMVSALAHGHSRLINTGPKEVHAGQQYRAHHNLAETGQSYLRESSTNAALARWTRHLTQVGLFVN